MAVTYDRYGAPRRKKKRNALFAPLAFLLILAALVFGAGVFFRVQEIQVVGAVSYTDEEIADASGIQLGDNLFFINRFTASSNIFSRLPFVEEASIERKLPNTIVITVGESYAAAYVDWMGQAWMITSGCKLLGTGDPEDLVGLVKVEALSPEAPSSGAMMEVAEEDSLKLAYLQQILPAMENQGMLGSVSELNLDNPANPSFRYLDRFTVLLGPNEDTEYKLRKVLGTVLQLQADLKGTIDVSGDSAVFFTPD